MDEQSLREVIRQVERGHLTRRGFVQAMTGLGLTAPMAAHQHPMARATRPRARRARAEASASTSVPSARRQDPLRARDADAESPIKSAHGIWR